MICPLLFRSVTSKSKLNHPEINDRLKHGFVFRLIEKERESKAFEQGKKFGWTDYYTLDEVRIKVRIKG